ncbi:hypothetical protein ACFVUS_31040 [Nocardia sp. NPDC058058]|uniref:hypothetical protein n=1 Tax=Nocardia sp. NPDC058058 TaxID=3346317 RepID=UPI0036D86639
MPGTVGRYPLAFDRGEAHDACMGLDLSAVIAHWDRLAEAVNRDAMEAIWDLIYPDAEEYVPHKPRDDESRFRWAPSEVAPWYGDYKFRGVACSGSIKPHWGLGKLWEDIRERPETPADLVDPFNRFLGRLLGDNHDETYGPNTFGGLPIDKISQGSMTAFSPAEVTTLARAWRGCADRLEELRPAMTAEISEYVSPFDNFDECAELLRDWAAVVDEAERRHWGLFYVAD